MTDDRVRQDKMREIRIRDAEASQYDQWYFESKGRWWQYVEESVILPWLELSQEDIILDAGCGTGRFSILIAPRVKRLFALDFSRRSLEVNRLKLQKLSEACVTLVQADLNAICLPDECVSKIASVQVIEHIPSSDRRLGVLREFARVLRPGGLLVLTLYRWGGSCYSSAREGRLLG